MTEEGEGEGEGKDPPLNSIMRGGRVAAAALWVLSISRIDSAADFNSGRGIYGAGDVAGSSGGSGLGGSDAGFCGGVGIT